LTDHFESSLEGTQTCAANAAKWLSASFDPASNLYIARVAEGCSTYRKDPRSLSWASASSAAAGEAEAARTSFAPFTSTPAPRRGTIPAEGYGGSGTLATAGELVFFGENGGTFTALNSKTGVPVWHFETGQPWRACPMTTWLAARNMWSLPGRAGS